MVNPLLVDENAIYNEQIATKSVNIFQTLKDIFFS